MSYEFDYIIHGMFVQKIMPVTPHLVVPSPTSAGIHNHMYQLIATYVHAVKTPLFWPWLDIWFLEGVIDLFAFLGQRELWYHDFLLTAWSNIFFSPPRERLISGSQFHPPPPPKIFQCPMGGGGGL